MRLLESTITLDVMLNQMVKIEKSKNESILLTLPEECKNLFKNLPDALDDQLLTMTTEKNGKRSIYFLDFKPIHEMKLEKFNQNGANLILNIESVNDEKSLYLVKEEYLNVKL